MAKASKWNVVQNVIEDDCNTIINQQPTNKQTIHPPSSNHQPSSRFQFFVVRMGFDDVSRVLI